MRKPCVLTMIGLLVVIWALPVTAQVGIRTKFTRNVELLITREPIQQEVFNDGSYALIKHKSWSDRYKTKGVEATCPEGMKAVSAGFSAASGAGEPDGFRLILSQPKDNGAGWVIYGSFDDSGNALAADYDWELRLTMVCISLP